MLIDLKKSKFSHADAGQMNMYLNYCRENECFPGENDPIGIVLCTDKNEELVRYSLGGMTQKIFVSRYKTSLPTEEQLLAEIRRTKAQFEQRKSLTPRLPEPGESCREDALRQLVEQRGKIFISDYQAVAGISRATAHRDIVRAVKQGWLDRHGKGRSSFYTLRQQGRQ